MYFRSEDGGIEMQILASNRNDDPISHASVEDNNNNTNNNNNSNDMSQANSAMSIEYPEQVTSTIGKLIFIFPMKNSFHIYFLSNFRFKSGRSSQE